MVSAVGLEPTTHALKGLFDRARPFVFNALNDAETIKTSLFGAGCPQGCPQAHKGGNSVANFIFHYFV